MAAASGLRPSDCVASVRGLAGFDPDFAEEGLVETGFFLPLVDSVFGLTDVDPRAGSTFGVGAGDLTLLDG